MVVRSACRCNVPGWQRPMSTSIRTLLILVMVIAVSLIVCSAKISSISTSWGRKGVLCATSGTLANGQVSCPKMAILKICLYLGNHCLLSENQLKFDPLGIWVERECMCHFWNFCQWQVACQNMVILKIDLYRRNRCP